MKNDSFFLFQRAVDDDLLEEAMQPPRRRKRRYLPLLPAAAAACLCLALGAAFLFRESGGRNEQSKRQDTLVQSTNAQQEVGAQTLMNLGYTLSVPDGAQEVAYALVDLGAAYSAPMAEVSYMVDEVCYTARALHAAQPTDLSGQTDAWSETLTWEDGGLALQLCSNTQESWVGWYAPESGTQWGICAQEDSQPLLNTACQIMKTLGYDVAVAPEEATDVRYSVFALGDVTVAETSFLLDGICYRWHMAQGSAEDPELLFDISASDTAYESQEETTLRWCRALLFHTDGGGAKLLWLDVAPGLVYSFEAEGAVSPESLLELAERLFVPAQDESP